MKLPILIPLTFLFILNLTTTSTSPPECDCYTISGPERGYFQHHQFWDFRHMSLRQDTSPDDDDIFTHTLPLSKTSFAKDWRPQTWARGTTQYARVPIVTADENVFFSRDPDLHEGDDEGEDQDGGGEGEESDSEDSDVDMNLGINSTSDSTYLVLRATRRRYYASTAEIESRRSNIFYCSLCVRLRVMSRVTLSGRPYGPVPRGACAGIFTYRSAGCESDIEILTDPKHVVRYSNQPDYNPATDTMIPGSSNWVNLSVPWTTWVTHRLDWLPGRSYWYADGVMQAANSYRVPDRPSLVALNLWSDGGPWSGNMDVGDTVYVAIEWIDFAYNVSSGNGSEYDLPPSSWDRQRFRPMFDFSAVAEMGIPGEEDSDEEDLDGEEGSKCRRQCWVTEFR